MTQNDRAQPHHTASSAASAIDDLWQAGGHVDTVAWRLDEMVRAILDERHEATAGLPQAAADEAVIDELMAKRAAGLRETPMRGQPQAPADRGEYAEFMAQFPDAKPIPDAEYWEQKAHEHCSAHFATVARNAELTDSLRKQVAALTAERDELGRQLMAEIEAKLFNINEVVKWTGLATEHRKELHATRAELRKRDAVVEAAKALRLAQNNWALEEALYTALDALEALTQPAASDVLLVPAKDPARNPALIDSFWRDPGGTED